MTITKTWTIAAAARTVTRTTARTIVRTAAKTAARTAPKTTARTAARTAAKTASNKWPYGRNTVPGQGAVFLHILIKKGWYYYVVDYQYNRTGTTPR